MSTAPTTTAPATAPRFTSHPPAGSEAAAEADILISQTRELLGETPGPQHAGTLAILALALEVRAAREVLGESLADLGEALSSRRGTTVADALESIADTLDDRVPAPATAGRWRR